MAKKKLRLVGLELYFTDLKRARRFYRQELGLEIAEEGAGRFVKFNAGNAFVCLERKGAESYPSRDKAVLFFEVDDLQKTIQSVGAENFAGMNLNASGGREGWAARHDPEGHNILFLERKSEVRRGKRPSRRGVPRK